MDFKVGDIWARCLECGGMEFKPLAEPQPDGNQSLGCKICGTRTTRTALLGQIGGEALKKPGPHGPPSVR